MAAMYGNFVWIFITTIKSRIVKVSLGHTPDADDAFMFYGMLKGAVRSSNFEVEHIIQDIEGLNRRAMKTELDVTAVSVHACAYIPGYTILRSGGSFGLGYGPILAAPSGFDTNQISQAKIAVPGKMTSAFLLLQLMIGKFSYLEMDFDQIQRSIMNGTVDAGLLIHEGQITYQNDNLTKVLDVGEWWDKTVGLPVPLGINVIKTSLGEDNILKFDDYLRRSIQYGLDHQHDAVRYAMQYCRGNSVDLIHRFVKMYVNSVTVEMGDKGEESIQRLFSMAREQDLVPEFDLRIAKSAGNRD